MTRDREICVRFATFAVLTILGGIIICIGIIRGETEEFRPAICRVTLAVIIEIKKPFPQGKCNHYELEYELDIPVRLPHYLPSGAAEKILQRYRGVKDVTITSCLDEAPRTIDCFYSSEKIILVRSPLWTLRAEFALFTAVLLLIALSAFSGVFFFGE